MRDKKATMVSNKQKLAKKSRIRRFETTSSTTSRRRKHQNRTHRRVRLPNLTTWSTKGKCYLPVVIIAPDDCRQSAVVDVPSCCERRIMIWKMKMEHGVKFAFELRVARKKPNLRKNEVFRV
jgi:hypothetical protein